MGMLPPSMGASPLMQRNSVLLPDPLGPQITTTSACVTLRVTCFRTWLEPNHLSTQSISIIGGIHLFRRCARGAAFDHLPALALGPGRTGLLRGCSTWTE